jgi:hypothetical protein
VPASLEHDPEKWLPVFRKDHAQTKKIERDDDSKKSHRALGHDELDAFAAARISPNGPFASRTIAKPRQQLHSRALERSDGI